MVTIIKREMLEHLQSLQFIILIVLSILLFSMNGWITVQKHRERMSRYSNGVTDSSRYRSTTGTSLHMRPSPLVLLADGGSKHQPPGYRLEPKGRLIPLPAGLLRSGTACAKRVYSMIPSWIGRSSLKSSSACMPCCWHFEESPAKRKSARCAWYCPMS